MDILYFDPNDTVGMTDSESIQNAVDRARECGINKVIIPRYNARTDDTVWVISEAIRLPSEMTVVLDNCYLVMADGVMTNFFRNDNAYTELTGKKEGRQYGITIKGEGAAVLDGGRHNGLTEKNSSTVLRTHVSLNHPILLVNIEDFVIENISIINPRYNAIRLEHAKRGRVRDIFVDASFDGPECVGLDVRNGCREVLLENICGRVLGDMVRLSPTDSQNNDGYSFICEGEAADVSAITLRNISGTAYKGSLVKIGGSEGLVYNVLVDNAYDSELDDNEGVVIGDNIVSLGADTEIGTHPSLVRNITLTNLRSANTASVVKVTGGVANSHITNLHALGVSRSVVKALAGTLIQNLTLDGTYFVSPGIDGACVVDFSELQTGDSVRGLYISNAHLTDVRTLIRVAREVADEVDVSSFAIFTDDGRESETVLV